MSTVTRGAATAARTNKEKIKLMRPDSRDWGECPVNVQVAVVGVPHMCPVFVCAQPEPAVLVLAVLLFLLACGGFTTHIAEPAIGEST